MTFDLGLLIGLVSIAVALFFGLFFGLRGFTRELSGQLSAIKEKVTAMHQTVEKVWDLMSNLVPQLIGERGGTVERHMKNLGKVSIEARPSIESTDYIIHVEKPVLREGLIAKLSKESQLLAKEEHLFSRAALVHGLSLSSIIVHLPCTEARICTEYMGIFLTWLDSTYFESLDRIRDFEEPILKE